MILLKNTNVALSNRGANIVKIINPLTFELIANLHINFQVICLVALGNSAFATCHNTKKKGEITIWNCRSLKCIQTIKSIDYDITFLIYYSNSTFVSITTTRSTNSIKK